MVDPLRNAFDTIDAAKPDTRTTAQRLADVLAESHREDTSVDFRLGLLQGALAVALPELLAPAVASTSPIAITLTRRVAKTTKTKRSRRNA